jgi:hypothetical protein
MGGAFTSLHLPKDVTIWFAPPSVSVNDRSGRILTIAETEEDFAIVTTVEFAMGPNEAG